MQRQRHHSGSLFRALRLRAGVVVALLIVLAAERAFGQGDVLPQIASLEARFLSAEEPLVAFPPLGPAGTFAATGGEAFYDGPSSLAGFEEDVFLERPPSLVSFVQLAQAEIEVDANNPPWLRDPESPEFYDPIYDLDGMEPWVNAPLYAPLGYTGPSSVMPTEGQQSAHFIPVEDRWRIGFEEWDRDGKGDTLIQDAPYELGHWWDPYNQNVLKGDYPIYGQHTFLTLTAASITLLDFRQVPTATTPFESTLRPGQEEFFGDPDQFFWNQNFKYTINLLHGDAAFKPADWQIRLSPVVNANYLDVEELAVVSPDVRQGTTRRRGYVSLDEWFIESKICDLSTDYDFASVRAGSQFFVSDFRGFIFSDTNRAVRLFGTRESNRQQFNLLYFDMTEKDSNSLLNTFEDRNQNVGIANFYMQDFIWPGYTAEVSYHYNRDGPDFLFDRNEFLVRPDPVGVAAPHEVEAHYIGFAGDGHINRYNINHAMYYVTGEDDLNPMAGRPIDIDAWFAAIELSYDRDWARFRTSFLWASGDDDPSDRRGQGFAAIVDNPNFAGGEFSFFQRQGIPLFGVGLTQRNSLLPDLRSNKFQGQANFVNPGLYLLNFGFDADITPKLKWINNANFLWFERTKPLEQFIFQNSVDSQIGVDVSTGLEYRPLLNNNIVFVGGVSGLIPSEGFEDLYSTLQRDTDGLAAAFMEAIFLY